jgi:HEPN domain-containing protein
MIARKQIDPQQWREAARWLVYVDYDLHALEALLAAPDPPLVPAGFHCQQAAEKMAKALLVALGAVPPKIHDVIELSELVYEHSPELGKLLQNVSSFSTWYVAFRYPDAADNFCPTIEDIAAAQAALRDLRRQVGLLEPKE